MNAIEAQAKVRAYKEDRKEELRKKYEDSPIMQKAIKSVLNEIEKKANSGKSFHKIETQTEENADILIQKLRDLGYHAHIDATEGHYRIKIDWLSTR